jgi:pilus assembly protein Flp/PilA
MRTVAVSPRVGAASKIGTGWTGVNLTEKSMKNLFSRFVNDESGVTAIEYGLIAALLAVVIIAAVTAVGTKLSDTFSTVANSL